jgi:hypothetical protein
VWVRRIPIEEAPQWEEDVVDIRGFAMCADHYEFHVTVNVLAAVDKVAYVFQDRFGFGREAAMLVREAVYWTACGVPLAVDQLSSGE